MNGLRSGSDTVLDNQETVDLQAAICRQMHFTADGIECSALYCSDQTYESKKLETGRT
jgi:hypothetical protein